MLKGFREFVTKGNVIDLAVAVILGIALTRVITSVTDGIVKPIVSLFGGTNPQGWGIQLVSGKPATFIALGPIVAAIIDFLIVAAVLYFLLIVPMQKMMANRYKAPETDNALLGEIRDLLRDSSTGAHTAVPTGRVSDPEVDEERRWFDNAARQSSKNVDDQY